MSSKMAQRLKKATDALKGTFTDGLPATVDHEVEVVIRPRYVLEHPVTGEKIPWDPVPLIEGQK